MAFDTNRDSVISRTGALEIDEGLRQYMLKVYNYMTIGLLITAGVSFFLAKSSLGLLFFSAETASVSVFNSVKSATSADCSTISKSEHGLK